MRKGVYEIYIRTCSTFINYRSTIITLEIPHGGMIYAKIHALVPASSICMGIYRHVVLSPPYGATVNARARKTRKTHVFYIGRYYLVLFPQNGRNVQTRDILAGHYNKQRYNSFIDGILQKF